MVAVSGIIVINGVSPASLIAVLAGSAIAIFPKHSRSEKPTSKSELTPPQQKNPENPDLESTTTAPTFRLYRLAELQRIVTVLKTGSSILVTGQEGDGKTYLFNCVGEKLKSEGFSVAKVEPSSPKIMLTTICQQLGIDTESLEGKALMIAQMQDAIANHLENHVAFILCDNAHHFAPAFRRFLESLLCEGRPMLLMATTPLAKDIFLKLPRLELRPMDGKAIRAIALSRADELGIKLKPAFLSQVVARAGGNPMLARRVVDEEYLGLEPTHDHTQWIDGTPYIIIILLLFTLSRVIGTGTNNTTLAMIGMTLTIGVRIIQTLFYSLPRQSKRLGR